MLSPRIPFRYPASFEIPCMDGSENDCIAITLEWNAGYFKGCRVFKRDLTGCRVFKRYFKGCRVFKRSQECELCMGKEPPQSKRGA